MILRLRLILATALALLVTAGMVPTQAFAAVVRNTYIIQTTAAGQDDVLKSLFGMGEVPLDQLDFVMDGFTVPLTDFEASVIAADPNVVSIAQDQKMSLLDTQSPVPSWGLDRIDQQSNTLDNSFSYPTDGGKGVRIYVVDTGVMASNPEFDGRILTGFDALGQNLQGADCHGHGTHVAGTAAGKTYGIAKAATIVPVRVLDCNGSGYTSNILTALDWILANNPAGTPAVVSMSIGGPLQPLFNAGIKKLYDGGILPIVAAGNSNDDACHYSPAATPEAVTVGASDPTDTRAYFSNYGDCVDIFAPGTNIVSAKATDPAGSTVMSGTSMATPHVSGVAALYLGEHPSAKPAELAKALKDNGIANQVNNAQSQFGNILLNDNFVRGAAPVVPNPNPVLNAPDQVASFNVSAVGANTATVNWVDGASNGGSPVTGHIVRALAAGDIYATAYSVLGAGATSFTMTTLNANTSYGFSVYAFNAIGSGKVSAVVQGKTLAGAPTAPTKPAASPGSSTASLSWSLVNNGGSPITSYSIELFSNAVPRWTAVSATTATATTLTGLTSGVTYLARVRAINALGTSNPSSSVSFTTVAGIPDVPTGLTAVNVSSASALVSWNPVASTSPSTPVTYVVTYGISGGTPISVATTTSSLQVTSLSPGRTYRFSVHAQVGEVVSAESTPAFFTTSAVVPAAPTNVTISGQIMRWLSSDDGGSPITGYLIQASGPLTSNTSPVDSWATFADQTSTSITLPAAPVGKYVRYRVIAKNAIGQSAPSLSIAVYSAPTKPGAPSGLSASAPAANGSITLTWLAPESDGGSPLTLYTIMVSRDGSTWSSLTTTAASANPSIVIARPTKGQTWLYAVTAKNIAGVGLASASISVSTAATVPGAPTGGALAFTGTDAITYRWNAPADNGGSTITAYVVERQVAGVWSTVAQLPADTLTYTATKALPGIASVFRVSALNAIGTSSVSAASTLVTPYRQASAPQNFTANINSINGRLDVRFDAPSDLGGGSVSTYFIQLSQNGGQTWSNTASVSGSTFALSLNAPLKGSSLAYRVIASTQAGYSLPGQMVTISVAATVPGLSGAPTISLTGLSDLTVRWNAPADRGGVAIVGYLLESQIGGAWSTVAQLPAETLSYVAPKAAPGAMNVFRVSAINSIGIGAASNAASLMTPRVQASAPQNFTATYNAVTARVDVKFEAPTDLGGGSISYYVLQASSNGGTTWSTVVNLTASTLAYSAAAPAKGQSLSYRVAAYTQAGLGLPSVTVSAMRPLTVPSSPLSPGYVFNVDGSVQLRWNAPQDNGGSPVTGYALQRQDGANWVDAQLLPGTTLTVAVVRDLPGSHPVWRVLAVNDQGYSVASSAISYAIPAIKSTAVQNLTVSATTSPTALLLSFGQPTNLGGGTLNSYQILYSRDGGTSWLTMTSTKNLSLTVSGPAKGITWSYRVVANTSFGAGETSNAVSYTGR